MTQLRLIEAPAKDWHYVLEQNLGFGWRAIGVYRLDEKADAERDLARIIEARRPK
jgi:hypothetical protein